MSLVLLATLAISSSRSVEPFFLGHSYAWKNVDYRVSNPILKKFNLSPTAVSKLILDVHKRMESESLSSKPSQDVREVAAEIVKQVSAAEAGISPTPNAFTNKWLLAEGVSRWVLLNVFYDKSQVGPNWIAKEEFIYFGKTETVMKQMPHAATCGGFSCVVRDLARGCGLDAYKVDGHIRGLGQTGSVPQNHSIAAFVIDGLLVPADLSDSRENLQDPANPAKLRRQPTGRLAEWAILPVSAEAWEVFLARFHAWDGLVNGQKLQNWDGDVQGTHPFTDLSLSDWEGKDTSALQSVLDGLRRNNQE